MSHIEHLKKHVLGMGEVGERTEAAIEALIAVAEAAQWQRNLDRNEGWMYSYSERSGERLDDALAALEDGK